MGTALSHRRFELPFHTKMLLSMCGVALLTGAVVFAVRDYGARSITKSMVNSLFRAVSNQAVRQTVDFTGRAAPVATTLEQLAGQGRGTRPGSKGWRCTGM